MIAAVAVVVPMPASANVTPTVTKTYQSLVPGAVSDTTVTLNFSYDSTAEDLKNVSFEIAAGSVGNLNAVPFNDRCNEAAVGLVATLDAPNYSLCPATAKIGTARLELERPDIGDSCMLTGNLYLLQRDPDLPAYIGSHLFSPAGCYAPIPVPTGLPAGAIQSITTSRVDTLTNSDFRLRTTLMPETGAATGNGDFVAPAIVPFGPVAGNLRVKMIEENVDGLLDTGRNFLTNPTRCTQWETDINAAALTTNTNLDYDIDGDGAPDRVRSNKFTTPDCTALPSFGPTMAVLLSSTARGQSPDASFVIQSPAPIGDSHIQTVKTLLPPALNSNLTGRSVCTVAERDATACPTNSKVGAATLYVPHLRGTFGGDVYLIQDSPLPGFAIYMSGNGISFRMDGKNNQAPDGSLVSEFTNLPQQPFTRFELTLTGGDGGVIAVRGCPSDASTPPDDTLFYDMTSWANQLTQTSIDLGLPACRGVTVASVESCVKSKLNVTPIYRDRAAVTQGELFIDKRRVATSTKSPYKFGINVSKYRRGAHEIKVRATYSDGKRKIDKATFSKCATRAAREPAAERRTEPRFTG